MQKNMFPGTGDFRKVLEARGIPKAELDRFFTRLEAEFGCISMDYRFRVRDRNASNGIPAQDTEQALESLRIAIASTKTMPFSEAVSPYVDIQSGELTPAGEMLVMKRYHAEAINSPSSGIVGIMESVPGLTFQDMSACSYEAFNYSRSGIAVGQPLLWLPLGNSLFLTRLEAFLSNSSGSAVVLNLGAGPGALERLIQKTLARYSGRINVVSVEMDRANLDALKAFHPDASYEHSIIEGDFVLPATRDRISASVPGESALFCIFGYSLHHVSPRKIAEMLDWARELSGPKHFIQVHDVSGGYDGGGQSPVNRLFFNFMTCYHLLVFPPDSFYTGNGFSRMSGNEAGSLVHDFRELFIPGTTEYNAWRMLENGSVAIFREDHIEP